MPATAIVFPSMIVPRRMLDAARFLDADALSFAGSLGGDVVLVDALASPGAALTRAEPGALRVGIDDERLVEAIPPDATRVYIATTPFHARGDVLALEALVAARAPGAAIVLGLPQVDGAASPAWELVDLGAHSQLQAAISAATGTAAVGLPVAASDSNGFSLARFEAGVAQARALGVDAVVVTSDLIDVDGAGLDALLDVVERHPIGVAWARGPRASTLTTSRFDRLARFASRVCVQVDQQVSPAEVDALVAHAARAGVELRATFDVAGPGRSERDVNAVLDRAIALFDEHGLKPHLVALPGGLDAAALESFLWTFDQRARAGEGPKKVIMNVTYRCNNRCTFCATGTRTQVDGNDERQRELLVKYRKLGVRLLDFDGGEPTLNEKLFELVGFARRIGYEKVNVTTNARMASYPAYANRLVRSGVTSVLVSIHGPDAQTHAQNVGVAEAFDQTCEGARNLVAAAPAHVELGANITLTKSNHKKLEQVAELVLSLGLKWFNLQFLTPFGRATSSVSPDTAEAAREAMRVIDKFRDRIKFQVINLPFCFMPGYEEFLLGDLLKLERHMLFVNNDEVNLFEYLKERRTKKEVCETCPRAVFCGGFYELEDVPEPTWLVRPEDLVRPIRPEVPSAGAQTGSGG